MWCEEITFQARGSTAAVAFANEQVVLEDIVSYEMQRGATHATPSRPNYRATEVLEFITPEHSMI